MAIERYTIKPAKYARGKMAISFPASFELKYLIERVIKAESNWSHRENAYIVSRRKAGHFELLVKHGFVYYTGDKMTRRHADAIYTLAEAIAAIKEGKVEVEDFLAAVDGA
jgi:hypothetical protein